MTVDDFVFDLASLIDDEIVECRGEYIAQSSCSSLVCGALLDFLDASRLHHRNASLSLVHRDLAADGKTTREQRDDLIIERVQFLSPQLQLIYRSTPKAFANCSPGFELARTLGCTNKNDD